MTGGKVRILIKLSNMNYPNNLFTLLISSSKSIQNPVYLNPTTIKIPFTTSSFFDLGFSEFPKHKIAKTLSENFHRVTIIFFSQGMMFKSKKSN